jgi:hypothetical protein
MVRMEKIGLADAIAAVRSELAAAAADGSANEIQFPVRGVDLEFQVGVTWEGGAGGKARFWVLDLESSARGARESVQLVKVSLGPPVNRQGEVVKVTRPSSDEP